MTAGRDPFIKTGPRDPAFGSATDGDRLFISSAEATRDVPQLRQGELTRPLKGRRADKLIRFLRDDIRRARADDSEVSPPRRHGYGLTKVETFRAFREIDSKGRLHVVDVIAGEPIDGVMAYEIVAEDTSFVIPGRFPGQISTDDEIVSGRFKKNGTIIRFFDGTQTAPDPDLVADTDWAATGVGQGVSYIYSRWTFIQGRFNGDPTVNVYARMGLATNPADVAFVTEGGVVAPLVPWTLISSTAGTSFPVPAGTDRLLAVAIATESGNLATIDGCSFGDQSLEFAMPNVAEAGGINRSAILFLDEQKIAAANGDTLQQIFSAVPARALTIAGVYQFVNQESPFVDVDSTTDPDGNSPALVLDTVENGYVFSFYSSGDQADITWTNGHQKQQEFDTSSATSAVADLAGDGSDQVIIVNASAAPRTLSQAVSLRPNAAQITNLGAFDYDNLPKTWSFNPYRHIFDLLIKPKDRGGKGRDLSQIAVETFQTVTAWGQGALDSPRFTRTAIFTTDSNKPFGTPPNNTNHLLEFDEPITPFTYGDVVQVSGQIPSSLSPGVDYHVIPVRPAINDFQLPAIALANSVDDAAAGNSIALGTVTVDYQVTKVRDIRFMSGFSYLTTEVDAALQQALQSCGAALYLDDQGRIAITQQVFPTDVDVVTEDELRGPVALSNRLPPDDRATEVAGSFVGLQNLFLSKDYPTRDGGGVFQAADGGERRTARINYPYIGKVSVAQRQATKDLRRIRQERTVSFRGSMTLIRLEPGRVFSLDKPSLGLDTATTFEVRDQSIFVEIVDDRPSLGVEITARQLEAETFDLSASDEEIVESARISGLQSPFDVPSPGKPQVGESLFRTKTGSGLKARASVTWTASSGAFVEAYRVGFKLSSDSAFGFLAPTPDTSVDIDDIAPGTYDFQVVALNSIGASSEPAETTGVVINGLAAKPAAPTGFFGQVTGPAIVLLQWDLSTDLDVTEGGLVEIRHDEDIAGGNGENSVLIATDVGGKAITQVAFKRGTYYLRFQDSSGQYSDFAEWSTEGRRPVPFAQIVSSGAFQANNATEDQITIQEDPTFPSTNGSNTLTVVSNRLELPAATTWDDVTNVDAVTNVDEIGADGEVQPDGVYFFQTGIELNAVTRVLLEAVIKTEIVDTADSIDNITNIDDVANIDAIGAAASQPGIATAWIEVRMSRDAVASDTFGPWQRLDTGIFNHRSFEFRVQARSLSPTVNVRVTQARILARELPVNV